MFTLFLGMGDVVSRTEMRRDLQYVLFMTVALVLAGAIFECKDKAGDVIGGDGDDEGVGYDGQHSDSLQYSIPDACQ